MTITTAKPKVQKHPDLPEGGRKYGAFQTEIYMDGLLKNRLPTVTTDPTKSDNKRENNLVQEALIM